jgi:endonuclease/exonuclease/phosphatase family metal-dependent hydrolase
MSDPVNAFPPRKPRRLRRVIAVAALVIVLTGAVGWFLSLPSSAGPAQGSSFIGTLVSRPPSSTLRLGTFNIDSGRGTDGVVNLDRTARSLQHLDFIGLNEVRGENPFDNQAQTLAELLHLPYLFAPAERRFGHDSFGNAVLTNLPIQRWQRIVLPSLRFKAFRNYVLTDAIWDGRVVHFLTTHTDWKAGGDEQRRIVIATFLQLPEPAVLMGDLNAPPSDGQIKQLLATPGVEESISTFLAGTPTPGRVDWIFLRGLTTVDAGVVDTGASDHPAYWAEVKLK